MSPGRLWLPSSGTTRQTRAAGARLPSGRRTRLCWGSGEGLRLGDCLLTGPFNLLGPALPSVTRGLRLDRGSGRRPPPPRRSSRSALREEASPGRRTPRVRQVVADEDDRLARSRKRPNVSKHFSWKLWSPTASTSSSSRMSKSTWIAIEYASRTCMPDEKFFSFWSTNRSSSAKATMSSKRRVELAPREPEQGAVDADVVAGGELGVEADAELDERREERRRAGRRRDPGGRSPRGSSAACSSRCRSGR